MPSLPSRGNKQAGKTMFKTLYSSVLILLAALIDLKVLEM